MSEVIIEKYVIEITRYPNGKTYQKIYPIGKEQSIRRQDAKKKKQESQQKLEILKEEARFKTEGVKLI